jgi:hypothetical protein
MMARRALTWLWRRRKGVSGQRITSDESIGVAREEKGWRQLTKRENKERRVVHLWLGEGGERNQGDKKNGNKKGNRNVKKQRYYYQSTFISTKRNFTKYFIKIASTLPVKLKLLRKLKPEKLFHK